MFFSAFHFQVAQWRFTSQHMPHEFGCVCFAIVHCSSAVTQDTIRYNEHNVSRRKRKVLVFIKVCVSVDFSAVV